MKRSRFPILGALAGIAAGLALTPAPLAAFFAATPVTWDASTCPAGAYTISAMATSLATGQSYRSTLTNVTLPRPVLVQNFQNLPTGTYTVGANLQTDGGESFASATQTITVDGGASAPSAPASTGAASARARPPSAPVIGIAQPRETPLPLPPPYGSVSGATASRRAVAAIAQDAAPLAATSARTRTALVESLVRMIAASDPTAARLDLHGDRVKLIDTDGTLQLVAVIGGEVWVWRIRN